MKILTLIPARSGSKGVPDKNIKKLLGKELFVYSIEQALQSTYSKFMRIIVTTDSDKYKRIAIKNGAEVPVLRPIDISQDSSTDFEFMDHMVKYLREKEGYKPDIILQLRPTQPLRKLQDIDKCIELFIKNYDSIDSLRSVVSTDKTPYKMYRISNGLLKPLFPNIVFNGEIMNEPYNQCRQNLPPTYFHNGYIDILKPDLLNENRISGDRIYPFVMDAIETWDIDTEKDWIKVEHKVLHP